MRYNILIGGAAGQGINKISQIVSEVLSDYGYFTFNYRDYPSLIREGHNFNVLSLSNKQIMSTDSKINIIVALDHNTKIIHENSLEKGGIILSSENFKDLDKNLNIALAGALIKIIGIPQHCLIKTVKKHFNNIKALEAAKKGFLSQDDKWKLKKLKNKTTILSGSKAVAIGAKKSKLSLYIAYPMTPATGTMHELASMQNKDLMVFQAENEIAVVNSALGASFTGKITMIGTSGGGFDLMSETFSLQGISEIPLTVYLASRPGPGTGVPTYTAQSDLNIALYSGHGEFSRIVCAPGDTNEAIEKTNELLYLSEKCRTLSILLSDKHLAESEYAIKENPNKIIPIIISRNLPGKKIVKASSYEINKLGNSTESATLTEKNVDKRLQKKLTIEKECNKFEMVKIHGKKKSKNLIIGWGSTKGAIIDSIQNLDAKFLQILYMTPFSPKIKEEIKKANKIILIENNATGQLGQLIRREIGIEIKKKILKYDGRPFYCNELNKQIKKELKK